MQPLSSSARQALAAYRGQAVLDPEHKSALRGRIDASIAAGAVAACEADEPVASKPRLDARGIAVRIALPVAIAAAVLLGLRAFAPDASVPRAEAPRPEGQAIYGVGGATEGETTRAQAPDDRGGHSRAPTPPASPEGEAPGARTASEPTSDEATSASAEAPSRGERRRAKATAPLEPGPSDPGPADTTLAAEMQLLRRARVALREGDPSRALAELKAHARRFASGQMVEDREALRVQALCDAGRGSEARVAASAFMRAHPGSPHAARVEKICAAE